MEDTMHENTAIEGVEGEVLEQVVEPEQVGGKLQHLQEKKL